MIRQFPKYYKALKKGLNSRVMPLSLERKFDLFPRQDIDNFKEVHRRPHMIQLTNYFLVEEFRIKEKGIRQINIASRNF